MRMAMHACTHAAMLLPLPHVWRSPPPPQLPHLAPMLGAGAFLAFGETGDAGSSVVSVLFLRNLSAPALRLHTPLQQRPGTAICLAHGALGERPSEAAPLSAHKRCRAACGRGCCGVSAPPDFPA